MTTSQLSKEVIVEITNRIQTIYLADEIPWVVGYSGGKDSTTVLQLVWNAIKALPEKDRKHKQIHVISTDTLVEQPIVAAWVNRSLKLMEEAAVEQDLPIKPHRLTPEINKSFWVNLIGRGYPAPRTNFRWCTSRLKIDPSNRFINEVIKQNGEAILVLGTRKAESASRAANMNKYEQMRTREYLSPNGSLLNSWVFSPIEDWTSDDVWMYLMMVNNPWGCSNKDLMAMYREATADNECPLVVDTTTPSCGNSRFGCWVCTLVSEDKSMKAMVQNDDEKVWMMPMLNFRNNIGKLGANGKIDDYGDRDFRRMNGGVKLFDSNPNKTIHGPYTKEKREKLLEELLKVEKEVRAACPPELSDDFRLITDEELRLIRKIWVEDKSEFDDAVPRIFERVYGVPFEDPNAPTMGSFGAEEWEILQELVGDGKDKYIHMDLLSSLLNVELNASRFGARKSIVQELENHIKRCFYENEQDAIDFKKQQIELREHRDLDLGEEDDLEEMEVEDSTP